MPHESLIRHSARAVCAAVLAGAVGWGGGGWVCSLLPQPKPRVGSAPFPEGAASFYAALDPQDLGPHRYTSLIPYFDAERSRGLIYTCRAGFIDLSHARHVADWARHYALRARRAIERFEPGFVIAGVDHADLEVTFTYPHWWGDLTPEAREAMTDAAALRVGQVGAFAMQTYHEIITWYGYRTIPFYPEFTSAFAYDDMVSHLVGVRMVAAATENGRLLRMNRRQYNRAMERAVSAEMRLLEAVPPKKTQAAMAAGEGTWWSHEGFVRRHADAGYDGGLVPWLVSGELGFHCGRDGHLKGHEPFLFEVPNFADVGGRDMTGFADVVLRPMFLQRRRVDRALPGNDASRLHNDRELPQLVRIVADDARRRLGDRGVDPPPGTPTGRPSQTLTADGGPPRSTSQAAK